MLSPLHCTVTARAAVRPTAYVLHDLLTPAAKDPAHRHDVVPSGTRLSAVTHRAAGTDVGHLAPQIFDALAALELQWEDLRQ